MDLKKEHDRKGMVATILIHSIIFLLMLIWVMGEAKDMEETAGGVEVSFGDPDAGGPSTTNQVTNSEPVPTPPSNPSETDAPTDNPVVTNETVDAPEMENSTKQTTTTKTTDPVTDPTESTQPSVSEAQKAMERWKSKKANSETTTSSGDGTKTGPKGKPSETKTGPGGGSSGTMGNFNYNLSGFGISEAPHIVNSSQDDGSVTVEVCLDQYGKIKSLRKTGGTSSSQYLKNLSIDAVRKFKFFPIGDQAATNCGTITFNYALH